MAAPTRFAVSRRLALLGGFSALLMLMMAVAFRADRALRDIEQRNAAIRRQFLTRGELLDRLRYNLYTSNIDVRDYLLEFDEIRAEERGKELEQAHRQMIDSLEKFARELPAEETPWLVELRRGVEGYWAVLEPVVGWNLSMRLGAGDAFLRQQVFPRHEQLLALSNQISAANARQLAVGDRRIATLFADVRNQITLTALLAALVGVTVAGFSIRRILSLEKVSESQYREVERARGELQRLSARLVATQEEERRRLSRELHDEVGQSMSALLLELNHLEATIREGGSDVAEPLARARTLGEKTVGVIRNMSLLLRPSMLDDLGLAPALRWQARELSRTSELRVKVVAADVPDDLPDEHRTCIYRIVQEALHNAQRHSHARTARVTVKHENDTIEVEVQDDGAGFDAKQDKGMGIIGMEERVKALGGAFRVESQQGKGATVTALLPLKAPAG
ncbi:MAG: MCP four helix bundle domain-containing protein [Acidobacteria bacterium]|nr:MCP four helix bundle domain-containing protein [Acidobacteriota bacterium]